MSAERAQFGWAFWPGWVLVSTVGLAVGLAVGFAIPFAVLDPVLDAVGFTGGFAEVEAMAFVILVVVGGSSVAIAQWLVLRRRGSRPGWWVVASIVGLAVGLAVVLAVDLADTLSYEGLAGYTVVGAVDGASIGIAQWLVLRRRGSRPGWWVVASIAGLAVGFAAGFAVAFVVGFAVGMTMVFAVDMTVSFAVGFAVGGAVGGAVVGAITGGVLVWQSRQFAAKGLNPQHAAE